MPGIWITTCTDGPDECIQLHECPYRAACLKLKEAVGYIPLTFLERHCGRSDDCALMWLLSKENQVMARAASLKALRKRNMDRLFASISHGRHSRHRASDGNVLKLPSAVLSAQNV